MFSTRNKDRADSNVAANAATESLGEAPPISCVEALFNRPIEFRGYTQSLEECGRV